MSEDSDDSNKDISEDKKEIETSVECYKCGTIYTAIYSYCPICRKPNIANKDW